MPSPSDPRRSAATVAAIARHPLSWGAVLALGVLLRGLAAFPTFRSPLQSDLTMSGLTTFEILRGDLQIFLFNGTRLGALESYLHLPVFALAGASRGSLFVAPQIMGAALLVAYAFLARELLGPEEGLAALFFLAVPAPAFLLWNILPGGYVGTLFFTTVTLACAVRILRRGPDPLPVFGLGLAAGLGWWGAALSLAGTLPAVLWIAWYRPDVARRGRSLLLAAAGLLLGALPWIAINIQVPFLSFGRGVSAQKGGFQYQPADGPGQILDNFVWLGRLLAGLLFREDGPRPGSLFPVVVLAGALHIAALTAAALHLARRAPWNVAKESRLRRVAPLLLPLLVAGCAGSLFVLSAAGSVRGNTERYILAIGLATPLLLASLGARIARRSRAAAVVAFLVLLTANISGYCLPGTTERAKRRSLARSEDRLLALLAERHIAWIYGDYWDVYSLNYLSRETLRAIPAVPAVDYQDYEQGLACAPAPFALISRDPLKTDAWMRRSGLRGETIRIDDAFDVFFPNPDPPLLWAPDAVALVRGFRQGKARCGAGPPGAPSVKARTFPVLNRAAPG